MFGPFGPYGMPRSNRISISTDQIAIENGPLIVHLSIEKGNVHGHVSLPKGVQSDFGLPSANWSFREVEWFPGYSLSS